MIVYVVHEDSDLVGESEGYIWGVFGDRDAAISYAQGMLRANGIGTAINAWDTEKPTERPGWVEYSPLA